MRGVLNRPVMCASVRGGCVCVRSGRPAACDQWQ